ncbi:MAG TPA: hypothetical protein VF092_23505 [Longimicrobium sp.]
MSGTKTLTNGSKAAIEVTLVGRRGADPSNGDLPPVTVTIAAGSTARDVRYGDDQNPYLNAVTVHIVDPNARASDEMRVTRRGGAGTLDHRLNAYSVFKIVSEPEQAAFSLTSSN